MESQLHHDAMNISRNINFVKPGKLDRKFCILTSFYHSLYAQLYLIRFFYALALFPFITGEMELDYYHHKLNIRIA